MILRFFLTDVSLADNYYESTYAVANRRRKDTTLGPQDIRNYEENFFELMNIGFNRRCVNEQFLGLDDSSGSLLKSAALKMSFHLELGKSKDEQLQDLKKLQRSQRAGVLKFFPQEFLQYYDYLVSLRINPTKIDLIKNVGFGSFFSFIVWANMSARSSFMYFVIGNLSILSLLITRNMPSSKIVPGMEKRKVATWSSNTFKTALAITLLFTGMTSLLTTLLLSPFTFNSSIKFKASMIISLLTSSFVTTFFEVFEDKNKNGWRWQKSSEGLLKPDDKARLSSLYGMEQLGDKYDFQYNPMVDEFPPKPKYIDEIDGKDPLISGGSGELDEAESLVHYNEWRQSRKDARRAPIEYAAPEESWVGSKVGMYVKKVPSWLSTAYNKYVIKANSWKSKKPKHQKDTSEFELIDGPMGFRDKRPDWLNLFGTGIWEEKISVSRRAARAFGSYRKSMWKIDKKVVLQPCDGADKAPPTK